jgi:hypothetical protein
MVVEAPLNSNQTTISYALRDKPENVSFAIWQYAFSALLTMLSHNSARVSLDQTPLPILVGQTGPYPLTGSSGFLGFTFTNGPLWMQFRIMDQFPRPFIIFREIDRWFFDFHGFPDG